MDNDLDPWLAHLRQEEWFDLLVVLRYTTATSAAMLATQGLSYHAGDAEILVIKFP